VACPFFHPVEPLEDSAWLLPPRLPLGRAYRGACTAPGPLEAGAEWTLRDTFCNTGYARGECSRFPLVGVLADALRFSVDSDDAGGIVLVWVEERQHEPFAFGRLRYDRGRASFADETGPENLVAQARAFVASYLARRTTQ
jgi:hypothetical protein